MTFNTNSMFVVLTGAFIVLATGAVFADLKMNYSQLAPKDLDQMNQLVLEKLKESKKNNTSIEPLKEAVKMVFSRPNEDGTVEKVLPLVKNPLSDQDEWESTVEALVDEAIGILNAPKDVSAKDQATYVIMLENMISEFKPELKKKGFEFRMVEKIANADVSLTKEAKNEKKLGMMRSTNSPSELAQKVIAGLKPKKK